MKNIIPKPKYATEEYVREQLRRQPAPLTLLDVQDQLPRSCGVAWAALALSAATAACAVYLLWRPPVPPPQPKPAAAIAQNRPLASDPVALDPKIATAVDPEEYSAQAASPSKGESAWVKIVLLPSVRCWVSLTDAKGRAYGGREIAPPPPDSLARADAWSFTADLLPVEVRSGCPGRMEYYVDGDRRYPENKSKAPEKSEVVELP